MLRGREASCRSMHIQCGRRCQRRISAMEAPGGDPFKKREGQQCPMLHQVREGLKINHCLWQLAVIGDLCQSSFCKKLGLEAMLLWIKVKQVNEEAETWVVNHSLHRLGYEWRTQADLPDALAAGLIWASFLNNRPNGRMCINSSLTSKDAAPQALVRYTPHASCFSANTSHPQFVCVFAHICLRSQRDKKGPWLNMKSH